MSYYKSTKAQSKALSTLRNWNSTRHNKPKEEDDLRNRFAALGVHGDTTSYQPENQLGATAISHIPGQDNASNVDCVHTGKQDNAEVTDLGSWHTVSRRNAKRPQAPTIATTESSNEALQSKSSVLPLLTHKNNPDWRRRDGETYRARQARNEAAMTLGMPAKTNATGQKSRMTWRPGPRTPDGVLHSDQKPGAIYYHRDIRLTEESSKVQGWSTYKDPEGNWWMEKGRYWIVVAVDGEEVHEIPIYTNNNTGLKRVRDKKKKREYSSVRPKHANPRDFVSQSPDNEILEVDWMKTNKDDTEGKLARLTMVAHWTGIRRRDINISPLRLIGKLSEASTMVACDNARVQRRRR